MKTALKYSCADLRALPEGPPHYQLIEGELLMSPSPNYSHQSLSLSLAAALYAHVSAHDLGVVLPAPMDVILADDLVVQPDLLFVAKSRRRIVREDGIHGAPDLCVEILSASSRELDTRFKRTAYARHGVTEYWIVDPDAKTLALHRLKEQPAPRQARFSACAMRLPRRCFQNSHST